MHGYSSGDRDATPLLLQLATIITIQRLKPALLPLSLSPRHSCVRGRASGGCDTTPLILQLAARQAFLRVRPFQTRPFPYLCHPYAAPVRQVADIVSGETTALIALESGRVVGTIDCSIQPGVADIADELEARSGGKAKKAQGGQRRDVSTARSQVFLKNLFVLPEQRRRGIARKLE